MRTQGLTTQLPGARPEPTAPRVSALHQGNLVGPVQGPPPPKSESAADPQGSGQPSSTMWGMSFVERFQKHFAFPGRGERKELQIFRLRIWG